MEFQSTRPVRGATLLPCSCNIISCFNPRAPCGARLSRHWVLSCVKGFNPRAPCGARQVWQVLFIQYHCFNPRAPCGARQQKRSRLPSFATYSWVLLAMNTVCLAHTSHTPPLMWFTHLYFFTSFSVYFTFALLKVLRKALINSAPPS